MWYRLSDMEHDQTWWVSFFYYALGFARENNLWVINPAEHCSHRLVSGVTQQQNLKISS